MKEEMLIKLHEDGLLLEKHLGKWKAPSNHHVPEVEEGDTVLFTPFVEKGLGLLASDFFRGSLHYYGIHMNRFNPNSILQLFIFVHLFEAFLQIPLLSVCFATSN